MRHIAAPLLGVLAAALLAGCHHAPKNQTPEEAEAKARAIFESRCASCHGLSGRGDGPLGVGLNPRPRNYTDRAWQAGVSDDEIRKAIVKGGIGVGKSALMPPNPDLEDEPQVVDDLLAIVRGFAGGDGGAPPTRASSPSPSAPR